jgi:hypothetical protein
MINEYYYFDMYPMYFYSKYEVKTLMKKYKTKKINNMIEKNMDIRENIDTKKTRSNLIKKTRSNSVSVSENIDTKKIRSNSVSVSENIDTKKIRSNSVKKNIKTRKCSNRKEDFVRSRSDSKLSKEDKEKKTKKKRENYFRRNSESCLRRRDGSRNLLGNDLFISYGYDKLNRKQVKVLSVNDRLNLNDVDTKKKLFEYISKQNKINISDKEIKKYDLYCVLYAFGCAPVDIFSDYYIRIKLNRYFCTTLINHNILIKQDKIYSQMISTKLFSYSKGYLLSYIHICIDIDRFQENVLLINCLKKFKKDYKVYTKSNLFSYIIPCNFKKYECVYMILSILEEQINKQITKKYNIPNVIEYFKLNNI